MVYDTQITICYDGVTKQRTPRRAGPFLQMGINRILWE
jgi:hypothetical protein